VVATAIGLRFALAVLARRPEGIFINPFEDKPTSAFGPMPQQARAS
jgi:hypothetical protein